MFGRTPKQPHVIIEKRLAYRFRRSSARPAMGTKEQKRMRRHVSQEYEKWAKKYEKKLGVIGPDGYPYASKPKLSNDRKEALVALRVQWIVHRRRADLEKFVRHMHPKSFILKLFGVAGKEKPYAEQ